MCNFDLFKTGNVIDDPSKLHHDCLIIEEEENGIDHYDEAKKKKMPKNWDLSMKVKYLRKWMCIIKNKFGLTIILTSQSRFNGYEKDQCLRLGHCEYEGNKVMRSTS